MLQRIQTIFLILVAICFFSLFAFPFAMSDISTAQFLQDQLYSVNDHILLQILAGLGGALSLFTIFRFRNRPVQMRLGYLLIVISILILILAVILFYNEANAILDKAQIEDQIGLYVPLIGIVFAFLAIRYIRKDDKLVKDSYSRLR